MGRRLPTRRLRIRRRRLSRPEATRARSCNLIGAPGAVGGQAIRSGAPGGRGQTATGASPGGSESRNSAPPKAHRLTSRRRRARARSPTRTRPASAAHCAWSACRCHIGIRMVNPASTTRKPLKQGPCTPPVSRSACLGDDADHHQAGEDRGEGRCAAPQRQLPDQRHRGRAAEPKPEQQAEGFGGVDEIERRVADQATGDGRRATASEARCSESRWCASSSASSVGRLIAALVACLVGVFHYYKTKSTPAGAHAATVGHSPTRAFDSRAGVRIVPRFDLPR